MPEPVRVRDQVTGHEYSTYSPSDGEIQLDEPAVDERGDLFPAKPATQPPASEPDTTIPGRTATSEES